VRLTGPLHHYVSHVLRMTEGQVLLLVDTSGEQHKGRILQISDSEAILSLEEHLPKVPLARPILTLIYGLSRRSRTEWVLQKATELGVDRIVLARCERSVSRPEASEGKRSRWEEIIKQASRQCGRPHLPQLCSPMPLAQALGWAESAQIRLLAATGSPPLSRQQVALESGEATLDEVALAVGPEGGFSRHEIEKAELFGFTPVGLGPLTLRTETAAITFVALVAFLTGRLGSATSCLSE
jgi:16S rRNA (uracil1498-N3)-methyltransferase